LGIFADESRFSVETLPAPTQVPCAVNVVWKGNRMFAPAGGGVSIRPEQAFQRDNLLPDDNGKLARQYQLIENSKPNWWWD